MQGIFDADNRVTKCPRCGSLNIMVLESRPREDFYFRRRKCNACGYRFSTAEISMDEYNDYVNKVNNYEQIMSKFKETFETISKEESYE